MWVGLLIVAILVFLVFVNVQANKWPRDPNVSYVDGVNAPKGGQGNGNVERLDDQTSESGCRKACGILDWCRAYTWYSGANDGTNPPAPSECYGMKNVGKKTPVLGANSGVRPPEFSATLQRRLGMASAGSSSPAPESFRTNSARGTFDERFSNRGDIAQGTMWAGYQHAT